MRAVFAALCLLLGCASPRSTPSRAEALRAQVAADPHSSRGEAALADLVELEFQRASAQHTVLGWKRFLEKHPTAPRADEARARLETLRFTGAKARGSAGAWERFLVEHPNGAHAEEARRELAEARRREATGGGAPVALDRGSEGAAAGGEAGDQLDHAAWDQAQGGATRKLLDYLRGHPAGLHREAAQRELFSRTLDVLLYEGELLRAREEAAKSPLTSGITDLEGRFDAAERTRRVLARASEPLRAALPSHYLRPLADLRRSLTAPDPLDRWQAAEELGEHSEPAAIDPLLDALRGARSPLVRQRAFESLQRVAAALPPALADHTLTQRTEALAALGDSPEVLIALAALAEAQGAPAQALTLFGLALQPVDPEPLVLLRTAQLRAQLGQPFSSAVAARQLAVWARDTAQRLDPSGPDFSPLWGARSLCAAVEYATAAEEALVKARASSTDFPEDLAEFLRVALEARRLGVARLRDAEAVLQRQDPHALRCTDRRVVDRLEEGRRLRIQAISKLGKEPEARAILELAAARDPAPEVRAAAAARLTAFWK